MFPSSAALCRAGILFALVVSSKTGAAAELRAGGYSFSDELGGFRLLSATGTGKADDPVVLVEEIFDVAPVTLVIRNLDLVAGRPFQAQLTLVKHVTNRSNRVWAEFDFELQEVLKHPSVYSDGLSFKQYSVLPSDIASDSFAENQRDFEPYDRIAFLKGHVDPEATAEFQVTITDATPVREFYLVQEPKLLSAGLPNAQRSFALLAK